MRSARIEALQSSTTGNGIHRSYQTYLDPSFRCYAPFRMHRRTPLSGHAVLVQRKHYHWQASTEQDASYGKYSLVSYCGTSKGDFSNRIAFGATLGELEGLNRSLCAKRQASHDTLADVRSDLTGSLNLLHIQETDSEAFIKWTRDLESARTYLDMMFASMPAASETTM